jgi:alternate signal-mediated exported protein
MKKSTKGAIAAGASAALLLGGAGSLAYWNAEGDVTGGSINAGTLTLTPTTPVAGWTLNGTAVTELSAVRIVPGDNLDFTGAWTVAATGQNLAATVDLTGLDVTGALGSKVTVTDTYTIGTPAVALGTTDQVTSAANDSVLRASVDVDFPFGTTADNTSQTLVLNLSTANVSLTQVNATL